MAWFEWTAAIITAVSIYLQARENIWNWPTAIVSVTMYSIVYVQSGLYSDALLQVYFLVTSIYGWYHWLKGGTGHTVLHVSRASKRVWVVSLVFGVAAWFALVAITSRMKGVSLPYIDGFTTTVSLIAQWMITRKLLESWVLWVVVNVIYVPMYISKQLYPTALLYTLLLGLAVKGYFDWRRSYRATLVADLGAAPA